MLRGTGGTLVTIADDSDDDYDFMGRHPSINDAGEVSFAASLRRGGESVLRGDGTR